MLAPALSQVRRWEAAARYEQQCRRTGGGDLLTWTQLRRTLLSAKAGFDLTRHAYLRAIYQETAQRIIVKKAGQMGASEYLVSYALHATDVRGMDVLYVMPTDNDVSDFSRTRFGPALEASPYLAGIVADASQVGKRGADKVTLKRVRDSWLYFRGGHVKTDGNAPQLKSIPADAIILDEYDELDPRAPELARKRMGHSRVQEERSVSTPTYLGTGIDALWAESDQRLWHVRCNRCGERQPMTIDQVVTAWDTLGRPTDWHGQTQGRAFVACRRCGSELDRLSAGEWVATYPGRSLVGFHLTKLFSAQTAVAAIVANLQTTDQSRRKEAFNQDLGEAYQPQGDGLTDAILDACRRDYAPSPQPGERTVMGVDVGRVLHVVIRGPVQGETGERPLRFAGEVTGFEDAAHLVRRFGVTTCVVDAMPETRSARDFQARQRAGLVWLAYYATEKGEAPSAWNDTEGRVNVDRTRSLDETMARFVEGVNTLPAGIRAVDGYYDHLKAPIRVTEKRRDGSLIARYVEDGPDHFAHAENYATVASMRPRAAWNVLAQGRAKGWGI